MPQEKLRAEKVGRRQGTREGGFRAEELKRGKGILKEKISYKKTGKQRRTWSKNLMYGERKRSALEGSAGRKQRVGEEICVAGGGTEDLERELGKCKELGSCRKG